MSSNPNTVMDKFMSMILGKSVAYAASEMDLGQTESAMDEMDSVAAIALPGGLGSLTGIQAIRVWFHPREECSSRLQVQMDDLVAEYRASMDFPLDDSIASWVWQQQRPLIIAAEAETRRRQTPRPTTSPHSARRWLRPDRENHAA